jgi:hypothetical protein
LFSSTASFLGDIQLYENISYNSTERGVGGGGSDFKEQPHLFHKEELFLRGEEWEAIAPYTLSTPLGAGCATGFLAERLADDSSGPDPIVVTLDRAVMYFY